MLPKAGARLISLLRAIPGTTVYPIYTVRLGREQGFGNVVSCAVIRALAVLRRCPAGARAVITDTSNLLDNENAQYIFKPIAGSATPAYNGSPSALQLTAVLVRRPGHRPARHPPDDPSPAPHERTGQHPLRMTRDMEGPRTPTWVRGHSYVSRDHIGVSDGIRTHDIQDHNLAL